MGISEREVFFPKGCFEGFEEELKLIWSEVLSCTLVNILLEIDPHFTSNFLSQFQCRFNVNLT